MPIPNQLGGGMNGQPSIPPANGPAPGGTPDLVGQIKQNWDNAQEQFKKLSESAKRMAMVRKEMDTLMKMGDAVTVEDVIKGAGSLVGAGFTPAVLAQMLSQMPTTGGQALQGWIGQQDQQARMMEAQLQKNLTDASIHRGLAGMAMLKVHDVQTQGRGKGPIQVPGGRPMRGMPSPMPGMTQGQPPDSPPNGGEEEDEGE